jgi:hypothetical protein
VRTGKRQESAVNRTISGCGERKLRIDIRARAKRTVRTSRTARLGARTQRLVHDLFDGAGAPTALGAATKTSINLPRRARRRLCDSHGFAYVVVGEDVAGTNDHGTDEGSLDRSIIGYLRPARDAKEKTVISSNSKLQC